MGRRELLLVLLVGCNPDFADEGEEGRYSVADPPDGKAPPPGWAPDAGAETGPDAEPDADAATVDPGTCVRAESRDIECVGYDGDAGADAGQRYAIACPADDAGNPTLPPPAIGCNYTGWADAGSLTMCCK